MHKITLSIIGLVLTVISASHTVTAADTTDVLRSVSHSWTVDSVVVTASRVPQYIDSLGRTVYVLTHERLKTLPVHSVAEALRYIPGVDVQQRGPLGAQADVSIRGGGFEQTAVLVNGMRVTDVQTAHNTLALPYTVEDIERIEVVKGGASRLYGPGAMDGAVNIVLRSATGTRVSASVVGGDFSFGQANLNTALQTGQTTQRLSITTTRHGNYRPSTDLDLLGVSYQLQSVVDVTRVEAFGSVIDKKYGAGLFYSPRFPDQWERTVTWNAGVRTSTSLDSVWKLDVGASYRAGADEFLLKRNDPAFYRNQHTTHTGSLQTLLHATTVLGRSTIAAEGGHDRIESSSLGKHHRNRIGGSIEHTMMVGDLLRLTAGANILTFSDRAPGIGWGADLVHPYQGGRVYATVNRSFRVPSYTELYYKDPTSIGDPALRPETAITSEIGWAHSLSSAISGSLSLFRRDQQDGIDYAFQGDSLPWKATNIQTIVVNGFEVNIALQVLETLPWTQMQTLRLGVSLNDATYSSPVATRYALRQLRWQGVVESSFALPLNISATFLVRLFERYTDHVLRSTADARVSVPILASHVGKPSLNVMLEVVNIWNAKYVDAGFGTVAPRWFRIGVSSSFEPE